MEPAVKERTVQRRLFTTSYNQIAQILAAGHAKETELVVKYNKLLHIHTRLIELDNLVKNSILDKCAEDELEKELLSSLEYQEKWLEIEAKYKAIMKKEEKPEKESKDKKKFKLPKIELMKFDGNIKNWLGFWGQFEKIDLDEHIDKGDKFLYLLNSVKEDTDVYNLVHSYPAGGNSYDACVAELKARYAREELLIEVYVREILGLILQKKANLTELFDQLNAHLRALNTLGVSKCAAFILPLVESAIPVETLKLWERSKFTNKKNHEEYLTALMDFLRLEVESLQRVEVAKNAFQTETVEKPPEATASCLLTTNKGNETKKTCIWCGKDTHVSAECFKVGNMTLEERKEHLKKERACLICLRKGHFTKNCKTYMKCLICSRRHNVAMCPGKEVEYKSKSTENKKEEQKPATSTTTNLSATQKEATLLQTLIVKIRNGDKTEKVRALFDNGSQKTYIKEDIIKNLGVKETRKEDLQHCLFGGVVLSNKAHGVFEVKVESLDGKFSLDIEALGQENICSYTEKLKIDREMSKLLNRHNIKLTDTESNLNEIGLLIGADFAGVMMTSGIVNLENGMVALQTKLGWTIQGRQSSSNNVISTLFCMSSQKLTDLWSLELLGIKDPAEVKSRSQIEADTLASFEKTVSRENDGRYVVELPFKVSSKDLLTNFEKSRQRLDTLTKKLIKCGKYKGYDSVFKEWLSLKIIEQVPEDCNTGHFLPHKAVIKESSLTSAIRPVFDASAPDKNGLSLNDCLEKGLNFIDKIPKLLLGFRTGAIGITSDIAKAFLQIVLPPRDRDYLKFLWWEDETLQNVIVYRHCRVVFGLTSSPFLLAATLKYHLQNVKGEYENTAQLLLKSFYVDNCVCSLDTKEETYAFIEESKKILKTAQFNLRMWVTAPLQINETGKQVVSVLGLLWDTVSDELSCNIAALPSPSSLKKMTKRVVLSLAQKIFDPIGLSCPVSLPPKLLLRETCNRKLTWDEDLPEDLEVEFQKWYENIHYLSQCKIPRRLSSLNMKTSEMSLHLFCDASKDGYGACVFVRTKKDNVVTVQLVSAKSRVTPPKEITIPRLELMAALIGSRLLGQVREDFDLTKYTEYCWTDSSVALCWIKKELSLNTFVGNRVKEIRQNSHVEDWRHIPGEDNWADLASRGCNAKILFDCRWWQGPAWLYLEQDKWPRSEFIIDEREVNLETKKTMCNVNLCTNENFTDRLLYFSKYSKIIRMMCWMLRFIKSCRRKVRSSCSEITGEEYEEAEKKIMRLVQIENEERLQKSIQNLRTFFDKENLIRLETKLVFSEISECTKYPIVVPASNKIVQEMVKQKHKSLQHAGTNILITEIRKKFWVFGIRRLAKSVIYNCMICKKNKVKPMDAPTAPLPINRIQSSAPFEVTGVDLAGPLLLKNGEKCWIVLYTCAVYRAIHLELTPSLSTESFIRTLRRFIARRGRVKIIYSDNGTNFVGTKNLFDALDWNEIQKETCIETIKWIFNAPTAAWWGGFWERMVRTLKELLRRTLGKASVTYDELQTLLCDCESVINNRPLTYVQDDKAEALEPLTPSCFLQPLPSSETADLDNIDSKSLNLRLKYMSKLREDFRQRFKSEYLTELVQRGKGKLKYEKIKEGCIVLLESEGKRMSWPLGIVTRLFTGKDGVNRSAEVKTALGYKVRPVQKLYLLEMSGIDSSDSSNSNNSGLKKGKLDDMEPAMVKDLKGNDEVSTSTVEQEKVTRCGRKMTKEDGLPSSICHRCRYVVELACELKDMAVKTHQLLTSAGESLSEASSRENLAENTLHDKSKQNTESIRKEHKEGNNEHNRTFKATGEENRVKTENMENIKKEQKSVSSEPSQGKIKTESAASKSKKAPKHLTCQICLTPFKSMSEVATHVATHYAGTSITSYLKQERPFKCEICHNKVMSKTQLIIHHRRHLNVNPFTCKHPGCTFVGRNQDSVRHHAVCHSARSLVCEWCGASFRRRWELTTHTLRAHPPSAAAEQCTVCGKHFRNKFTLQAHLYNHHRPPRYVCSFAGCLKSFPSPAPLAAHTRTHSGARLFKCSLCDAAAYTSQSMLNRHLRMHERSRLSKCDKCSETFDDYGAFYKHRISEHGPWKPFRCVGCNKGYQSEEKLKTHQEICEQAIRIQTAKSNSVSPAIMVTSVDEVTEVTGNKPLMMDSNGREVLLVTSEVREVTGNKPLMMDSNGREVLLVTSEVREVTGNKPLMMDEDLMERFRGQALLVQPANIEDLSKELVLQDLPADGLLYIEVDSDIKEDAINNGWQE